MKGFSAALTLILLTTVDPELWAGGATIMTWGWGAAMAVDIFSLRGPARVGKGVGKRWARAPEGATAP